MTEFQLIPIDQIKVGDRFRKDMGDLDTLVKSIKEHGLLQPILVNKDFKLIAGGRRLEACKRLGWTEMPAQIFDTDNPVDCEVHENTVRKNHNVSEMVAIKQFYESEEKAAAIERMKAGQPLSESDEGGRVDDRIASLFGTSRDTLRKAERIVEEAERNPGKFGHLLEMVDQGKISVNRAYKQLIDDLNKEQAAHKGYGIVSNNKERTATAADVKETIEFEFTLPYRDVKELVESISELPFDITMNGIIDKRTGQVISAGLGQIAKEEVPLEEEMKIPREEPVFGFEISNTTGEITIAPGHTVACGLTQDSGKTTALEGLLARWAGKKIIVFICKRGEKAFQRYRRITPFMAKAFTGPANTEFTDRLELEEGIQVMELHNFDGKLQAEVIGSTAEEVQKRWQNVILVIPEAWQILPRDRDSPAKLPVESLVRQGAAIGNFVVLDSQDIAGIDVPIRKHIGNWIIGKQSEINEIRRVIEHLPVNVDWEHMKRDIQTLKLGQFYVVSRGQVKKAFAWPAWMEFWDGVNCAERPDYVYEIKKKYNEVRDAD